MTRVYIVGGDYNIESMFLSRGIEAVHNPSEANLACFTGGADVTPSLYGERNVASNSDWLRDVNEQDEYAEIQGLGIPCVGICRGGQFLNVMNGGKMWQDVNAHAIMGTHVLQMYSCVGSKYPDLLLGKYLVTSTHHQMMRNGPEGDVIGTAELATRFFHDGNDEKPEYDTEIVWYPNSRSLCFQPHPEYNGRRDDTEGLFFALLEQYGII